MARYRITFDVDAVDQNDARHWAHWIAGLETIMRDVDVYSVVRLAASMTVPPQKRSNEEAPGRDRHR